jgi:tight adherence protein C
MLELSILAATFTGVLLASMVIIRVLIARRNVTTRIETIGDENAVRFRDLKFSELTGIENRDVEYIKNFFDVDRNIKDKNAIPVRLIRAGYFSKNAVYYYSVLRISATLLISFSLIFILFNLFPELSRTVTLIIAFFAAGLFYVISNIALEFIGNKREISYRRLFPDFMDMMIVCVDAGLSIEAAIDRISKEFLQTHHDFGIHLSVMMLEVRGGRRLRDALMNFAQRLNIDEARALAILFRQSEELGSSVTKALRVFSNEMRETRLLKAEEKANALPIKMLFPLATFLFPMSLLIVLVPIMMKIIKLLGSMAPPPA